MPIFNACKASAASGLDLEEEKLNKLWNEEFLVDTAGMTPEEKAAYAEINQRTVQALKDQGANDNSEPLRPAEARRPTQTQGIGIQCDEKDRKSVV